jgi:hypothetical protein
LAGSLDTESNRQKRSQRFRTVIAVPEGRDVTPNRIHRVADLTGQ